MSQVPLQIIGGGPAGLSLLIALTNLAAGDDREKSAWAARQLQSLVLIEANQRPGGLMGHYQINANTSSPDVVLGITDGTPFTNLRDRYLALPEMQQDLIPLPFIEAHMVQPLVNETIQLLGHRLRTSTQVARVEGVDGIYRSIDTTGALVAESQQVVFCCGGSEPLLPELQAWSDKTESSGAFLRRNNTEGLPSGSGPIVIVGASHSAFSCAWRLLHEPYLQKFSEGREILMLHRGETIKLRCTQQFAAENGISYNPETDVCPETGIVFFNAGLRKDAKYLYLRIRDGLENRVQMQRIDSLADVTHSLQTASLILQATGFSATLPSIAKDGVPVSIGNPTSFGELTNRDDGCPIPGLFGMGLGFRMLPKRRDRGEPSFQGTINGFQSYPQIIAPEIIARMMK